MSKKGSTLKGKNLLPFLSKFFPFRVAPFWEAFWYGGKHVSFVQKMPENISGLRTVVLGGSERLALDSCTQWRASAGAGVQGKTLACNFFHLSGKGCGLWMWHYFFPLVWEGLRLVNVTLLGLFSYLFLHFWTQPRHMQSLQAQNENNITDSHLLYDADFWWCLSMPMGVENLNVCHCPEALYEWSWTGPMLFSTGCYTLSRPCIIFHKKI